MLFLTHRPVPVLIATSDNANADVLQTLSLLGVRMIAMRCAGFDRVDTKAAKAFNMTVARVPAYSPYAVAEMAVALLMAVNRKIHRAAQRVKMGTCTVCWTGPLREKHHIFIIRVLSHACIHAHLFLSANFTLDAGLIGVDIYGKTVGVMGTGKIGQIMCDIMLGFGVKLLCYDVYESQAIKDKGGVYVSQDELFAKSDVIMLSMPLIKPTYHTINMDTLKKLKKGVILINTSRGGLVDTKALLKGLQTGVFGGVGMDVYENEQAYFFQGKVECSQMWRCCLSPPISHFFVCADWSAKHMQDEDLMSLLGNNNVVLTAHQAFFTQEAVDKIVETSLSNLYDFSKGKTGQEHPNNCIPAETA